MRVYRWIPFRAVAMRVQSRIEKRKATIAASTIQIHLVTFGAFWQQKATPQHMGSWYNSYNPSYRAFAEVGKAEKTLESELREAARYSG